MLDAMFEKMFEKGLSQSSVRYVQRVLSVALEAARKYRYIETNPARDIITKFGKQGKTPDPYTVAQMQQLMRTSSVRNGKCLSCLAACTGFVSAKY